ncbi:M24 family metallopeptidase [Desulfotalea psychrophila]|uniref:Related to Xaa-Pro dipeptidase n=1 Tax=Desulfotalea psychrophila (strain LSv54 / DSM 12343) TaxID=177439 RepID=Q6AS20_DESPS|nr:Xaa-Pro peptidase family protein [Desulfotalea psychrophila]CAG34855.1 related to Xaa-Pro dipeptidase [Desulfotalea psychrophila LSv54]
MNYAKRIKKIQKTLSRKNLDALLVSQPENRRYLSGYTGGDHGIGETSGVLIIPAKGKVHLLTDFRYQLQAEQDASWTKVLIYTKGLIPLLLKLLPELGIKTLAFESDYTLHSFAKSLREKLGTVGVTTTPSLNLIEKMRLIKDEDEIDAIRRSVLLNEAVFQEVYADLKPGITETELAIKIEATMRRRGAERPSFDTIVASGKNSALPHAVPGMDKIRKESPLTIDMGLILDGYCSDMTRTFVLGKPGKKYLKYHRLVRRAQLAGMKAVRAGVTGQEVDAVARKIISDAGYGEYFGHSLGHGVGLAVHENPRLSFSNNKKLREGMIVTVEPGIYIPGWGGIRLENMVVVRKDGCENLNQDTTFLDL